jgi:hypothetical protein
MPRSRSGTTPSISCRAARRSPIPRFLSGRGGCSRQQAAAGHDHVRPDDHGLAPLAAVHTPDYLRFLETIYTRWRRIPDASPEVVPNIHPDRRGCSYPASAVGQAGYHQADTACPISAETWSSVYWSAQTAAQAASMVAGGERRVYALSRPPGHHAFADMAGGFCFVNNSAVAAEILRATARTGSDPRRRSPSRQRDAGHLLAPFRCAHGVNPRRPCALLSFLLGARA